MDDNAMTYEYLIRRCYNTGRYGKPCADADIYRSLQMSSIEMQKASGSADSKAVEKLTKEYNKELGKVITCITKALDTGMNKFRSKLSDKDQSDLQSSINLLANADKQTLEQVMSETEAIFVRNQIFPG